MCASDKQIYPTLLLPLYLEFITSYTVSIKWIWLSMIKKYLAQLAVS